MAEDIATASGTFHPTDFGTSPTPKTSVSNQIDALNTAVTDLSEKIEKLFAVLSPILIQTEPEVDSDSATEAVDNPGDSQTVQQLRGLELRVLSLGTTLYRQGNRIQL